MFFRNPIRFVGASIQAWKLGRLSKRGFGYHVIYLAEACVLRKWLAQDGITHLHVHFATNSGTVALLCRLLGGPPYSLTIHGPEEFDMAAQLAAAPK